MTLNGPEARSRKTFVTYELPVVQVENRCKLKYTVNSCELMIKRKGKKVAKEYF